MKNKKEKDAKARRQVMGALSMVLQFGINMLVPIFMCTFLGIWIDKSAGTNFWVIILFFVGALAGFTNVFRLAMKMNESEDHDEKK